MLKLLGGQLGNVLDGELLFGGLYVSCKFILGDVGRVVDELWCGGFIGGLDSLGRARSFGI